MKTTRGKEWTYFCRKCGTHTDGMGLTRADVDEFAVQHRGQCAGRFPNDPGPVRAPNRNVSMWPTILSHK